MDAILRHPKSHAFNIRLDGRLIRLGTRRAFWPHMRKTKMPGKWQLLLLQFLILSVNFSYFWHYPNHVLLWPGAQVVLELGHLISLFCKQVRLPYLHYYDKDNSSCWCLFKWRVDVFELCWFHFSSAIIKKYCLASQITSVHIIRI